jgi:hypothetical protein
MKLPTYSEGVGNQFLGHMTKAQALAYATKNMPRDLKKAGFKAGVFESDTAIHGAQYYRIGYGKTV